MLSPQLAYIPNSVAMIINASATGSEGNAYGFEDGSVVRIHNDTHMFVSELYTDPRWIGMRLAHWKTSAPLGNENWTRVGTIELDGRPMISTRNCRGDDHNAALWSPVMHWDTHEDVWMATYIAYACDTTRGYGRDRDGRVMLMRSLVSGFSGIAGPYVSAGLLLARGTAGGNKSQAWEGWQGDDSFWPFQLDSNDELLAFYGSSNYGHPWQVGLAKSASRTMAGPWVRLPHGNPIDLKNDGHTENPTVLVAECETKRLALMVHDTVGHNRRGFGFSWSTDGIHWAPSQGIDIPGGAEAPHGMLSVPAAPESSPQVIIWYNIRHPRGFDELWTARFALHCNIAA